MRFTTSRRPSPRARRVGRVLASFFGARYMTRGKAGLDDGDEGWMVVVEGEGGPAGIARRSGGEERTLSFSLALEGGPKRLRKKRAAVVGSGKAAAEVAEFFGLAVSAPGSEGRLVRVEDGTIEFVDDGDLILRLEI
ncbi:MAG: putative Brix domain-containing ribosomal biogenesis protein [Methanosaeta sp. PtaU1.Bin055]|nr:MAG: putative Brix domain-containing ribosomal biogenesis protein [Methanosaeta sp. PtaU1.Bin055]